LFGKRVLASVSTLTDRLAAYPRSYLFLSAAHSGFSHLDFLQGTTADLALRQVIASEKNFAPCILLASELNSAPRILLVSELNFALRPILVSELNYAPRLMIEANITFQYTDTAIRYFR
jgi:hypothetical protein